jgi:hypothetical protein
MFYDTLTCTTCGRDRICVVITTYDINDPMRVPKVKAHCTECLHDTFQEIAEGIRLERLSSIKRIK